MPRILIFANGTLPEPEAVRSLVRPDDLIIAADGGTRHVLALGLVPAFVVGDMDSLPDADRRAIEAAGTRFVLYPHDKNETDLELALRQALEFDPDAILLVSVLGGRLDQTLGNLSLLSDAALARFDVRADDGLEEAFFCRSEVEIRGRRGDIVSLIPWGDPVEAVRTEGLRWPLRGETLYSQKTRGISNELAGELASVRIASGLLLIVHRRI
jgi:thiamine pyrophosphokinase